jgi:hypothetical protein
MLAVAACDTVPLNFRTPPRPSKAAKPFLHEKAEIEVKKGGQVLGVESLSIAERREKLKSVLAVEGYSCKERELTLAEAEKVGLQADWVKAFLCGYKSQEDKRFSGALPTPPSSRGTRAHRVNYSGMEISRRMACYWRGHARFQACIRFLRLLFTRPLPKTPYPDLWSEISWEVNSAFKRQLSFLAKRKSTFSGGAAEPKP